MSAPIADAEGAWVRLEVLRESHVDELADLDWARSQSAALGGLALRGGGSTVVFRSKESGAAIGVLDAMPLPGYPGVINVSLFTDVAGAGLAIDAYALFATGLFDGGVRLIHHEVFEFNRPIRRILTGIGLAPTARLREHGFAAGRTWDVLVYSFDHPHWLGVLRKFESRGIGRPIGQILRSNP